MYMVDESDMEAECSGFLSVLTEKKHLGCDKVMEEEESYRLMEQSPKETRERFPQLLPFLLPTGTPSF